MSDMSHLIFSFILFSCLTHIVLESIHCIFLLFWVFLLKYSNSTLIQLPMSDMSHLNFFIHLIFLDSHTYSEKPNFLMFVIFLLTQPSAIFASRGLLARAIRQPLSTSTAPSCCPLPPLSPPLPSSTIEATHR